jgi:hypothetical protein
MTLDDNLPELALSVRQPWAHAIIYFDKDVENRTWQAVNHGLKIRGRIAIHASKRLGKAEYWEAREFIDSLGWTCPDASALRRGGIVGSVEVVEVVSKHDSPWFFGPRGLILRDPRPCTFVPSVGELGYFKWKRAQQSIVPPPAPWMLPKPRKLQRTIMATQPMPELSSPDLFDRAKSQFKQEG